ncbi:M20/M25/M40 family metallo-hydrolase [Haliangium sp.]|uniref:M20/M25/M40 family metallo-hydrolase n=1 Tax=Haliangium sp. TaxID=2663208 RepID=UPI003D0C78A9
MNRSRRRNGRIWRVLAVLAVLWAGCTTSAVPATTPESTTPPAAASGPARLREAALAEPDNPAAHLVLAILAARSDPDAALVHLAELERRGWDIPPGDLFPALVDRADYQAWASRVQARAPRVSSSVVYATIPDPALIPEGIAADPDAGTLYVGSITQRKIVRIHPDGVTTDFVPAGSDGLGPVLGMHVDSARGLLWAASNSAESSPDTAPASVTGSGVFAFDLATGALRHQVRLGAGDDHLLNDLVVSADGQVFVTDSAAGAVYRLPPGAAALQPLVPPGTLHAPNGVALDEDHGRLLVAHVFGISAVEIDTGEVRALAAPEGVVTGGIDGLSLAESSLIGIQNAFGEGRVVRFDLDQAHDRIVAAHVLEAGSPHLHIPTTGAFMAGRWYYIANSHLDALGDDGALIDGASVRDPVILSLPLRPEHARLTAEERRLVAEVDARADAAVAMLERVVDINSGTMNLAGVREVGHVFAEAFERIGFETEWIAQQRQGRAGHLFARRRGASGKRVLLIGHLDTVFEADSEFQRFERLSDDRARGPGVIDIKGGDVAILHALAALDAIGALDDATITVALLGDEESPGGPASRDALIQAARASDVALGFECGLGPNAATIARRGLSEWRLEVQAKPGHSSGIFSDTAGAGAVYEAARVLADFYDALSDQPNLTVNAGLILGGTTIEHDRAHDRGVGVGKSNVIPGAAVVTGDLRALSDQQRERAKATMREIAARSLPQAAATLHFDDGYPSMAPTAGNRRLLFELDEVARALGLGPVRVIDPGRRGAADISFVAPHVPAALAGLGVDGDGWHTPAETIALDSLRVSTQRAAVLLYRLTRAQ